MSSKRPPVDLMALTSGTAVPMGEAVQRSPSPPVAVMPESQQEETQRPIKRERRAAELEKVKSPNLESLGFKVPPEFRRRFLISAAQANLKLNELLFESFDAWEKQARSKGRL